MFIMPNFEVITVGKSAVTQMLITDDKCKNYEYFYL